MRKPRKGPGAESNAALFRRNNPAGNELHRTPDWPVACSISGLILQMPTILSDFDPTTLSECRDPLDVFFHPRHVAVICATETTGSVGRAILWNLISNPFG